LPANDPIDVLLIGTTIGGGAKDAGREKKILSGDVIEAQIVSSPNRASDWTETLFDWTQRLRNQIGRCELSVADGGLRRGGGLAWCLLLSFSARQRLPSQPLPNQGDTMFKPSTYRRTLPVLLAGLLGACGAPDAALDGEATSSRVSAVITTPWYGLTSGTEVGPGNSARDVEPTKILTWSDNNYIYGIKLFWGVASLMYGSSANGSKQVFDLSGGLYIKKVEYHVDAAGLLRGIRFSADNDDALTVGQLASINVAFSGENLHFTDLITKSGVVSGKSTIWGAQFTYTNE
jgi:hypothetical protein